MSDFSVPESFLKEIGKHYPELHHIFEHMLVPRYGPTLSPVVPDKDELARCHAVMIGLLEDLSKQFHLAIHTSTGPDVLVHSCLNAAARSLMDLVTFGAHLGALGIAKPTCQHCIQTGAQMPLPASVPAPRKRRKARS